MFSKFCESTTIAFLALVKFSINLPEAIRAATRKLPIAIYLLLPHIYPRFERHVVLKRNIVTRNRDRLKRNDFDKIIIWLFLDSLMSSNRDGGGGGMG